MEPYEPSKSAAMTTPLSKHIPTTDVPVTNGVLYYNNFKNYFYLNELDWLSFKLTACEFYYFAFSKVLS
jgi:hypothetical protein